MINFFFLLLIFVPCCWSVCTPIDYCQLSNYYFVQGSIENVQPGTPMWTVGSNSWWTWSASSPRLLLKGMSPEPPTTPVALQETNSTVNQLISLQNHVCLVTWADGLVVCVDERSSAASSVSLSAPLMYVSALPGDSSFVALLANGTVAQFIAQDSIRLMNSVGLDLSLSKQSFVSPALGSRVLVFTGNRVALVDFASQSVQWIPSLSDLTFSQVLADEFSFLFWLVTDTKIVSFNPGDGRVVQTAVHPIPSLSVAARQLLEPEVNAVVDSQAVAAAANGVDLAEVAVSFAVSPPPAHQRASFSTDGQWIYVSVDLLLSLPGDNTTIVVRRHQPARVDLVVDLGGAQLLFDPDCGTNGPSNAEPEPITMQPLPSSNILGPGVLIGPMTHSSLSRALTAPADEPCGSVPLGIAEPGFVVFHSTFSTNIFGQSIANPDECCIADNQCVSTDTDSSISCQCVRPTSQNVWVSSTCACQCTSSAPPTSSPPTSPPTLDDDFAQNDPRLPPPPPPPPPTPKRLPATLSPTPRPSTAPTAVPTLATPLPPRSVLASPQFIVPVAVCGVFMLILAVVVFFAAQTKTSRRKSSSSRRSRGRRRRLVQ